MLESADQTAGLVAREMGERIGGPQQQETNDSRLVQSCCHRCFSSTSILCLKDIDLDDWERISTRRAAKIRQVGQ
jgi:hypothetical protein